MLRSGAEALLRRLRHSNLGVAICHPEEMPTTVSGFLEMTANLYFFGYISLPAPTGNNLLNESMLEWSRSSCCFYATSRVDEDLFSELQSHNWRVIAVDLLPPSYPDRDRERRRGEPPPPAPSFVPVDPRRNCNDASIPGEAATSGEVREQTRVVLTSAAYVHLKQAEISKYTRNLAPTNRAILLSGPAGWAFADSVLHRLAPLWIGARGLEFTWEYIFQGLEANANLVMTLSLAALGSLMCLRKNKPRTLIPIIYACALLLETMPSITSSRSTSTMPTRLLPLSLSLKVEHDKD
ncbi:hypothetical protein ZWY2020_044807 [Hordeum vulgare]|nr:hypothetical protein ZWY2020_044807 [Hordeum vulgare]